jgi:hypothetical protein
MSEQEQEQDTEQEAVNKSQAPDWPETKRQYQPPSRAERDPDGPGGSPDDDDE